MVRSQILSQYPNAENNQVVRAPEELDSIKRSLQPIVLNSQPPVQRRKKS